MYAERFPQRHHRATFVSLIRCARNSGDLQPHLHYRDGAGCPLRVLNQEQRILNVLQKNPFIATQRIAEKSDIISSHSIV